MVQGADPEAEPPHASDLPLTGGKWSDTSARREPLTGSYFPSAGSGDSTGAFLRACDIIVDLSDLKIAETPSFWRTSHETRRSRNREMVVSTPHQFCQRLSKDLVDNEAIFESLPMVLSFLRNLGFIFSRSLSASSRQDASTTDSGKSRPGTRPYRSRGEPLGRLSLLQYRWSNVHLALRVCAGITLGAASCLFSPLWSHLCRGRV